MKFQVLTRYLIDVDRIKVGRVRIVAWIWDHHRRRRVALVPLSPPTVN